MGEKKQKEGKKERRDKKKSRRREGTLRTRRSEGHVKVGRLQQKADGRLTLTLGPLARPNWLIKSERESGF